MAKKYLDYDGLLYLWGKIKTLFAGKVDKVDGMGLSTNDYTTAEKNKLSEIEEGATNTTIVDLLTSTSTTSALSANQGKVLNDKISAINTNMEDLGAGDMLKSVYDTDNNGVVDDADKLGGQLPSYYAKATDIPTVTNDLTAALKANYDSAYTHSQTAHAPANAQANVIESIAVNGVALTVADKAVDVTVPTKVSQLTNDSGFLTEHQDISGKADKAATLAGYGITDAYTKTDTDTAIATAVAGASHLKREIVVALPAVASADANTIYMVLADADSGDNKYIEWMVINAAWEKVGDTDVDLSGYVLESDLVAITNAEIDTIMAA